MESRLRLGEVVAALVLQLLVAALLVLPHRWYRRRWVGISVVVVFLASVALLRDGVGTIAAYGVLVIPPVAWAALRTRRVELITALTGTLLVLFVPLVFIGGSHYPETTWVSAVQTAVIALVLGVTVYWLVWRLRANEQRYRLLAENSTDLVVRFAPDDTIVYASPASIALFGFEPSAMVGYRIADLLHPDDRHKRDEWAAAADAATDVAVVESRLRHRDGRWLWAEASIRPVRDRSGAISERQAAIRLIEDRKQLQLTIERQRDDANELLALVDDGVALVGADLEVLEANDKVLEMVGMTREQVIGLRPPYPWWPPEHASMYLDETRKAAQYAAAAGAQAKDRHFDSEWIGADGVRLPVWITMRALPGGRGTLVTVRDVSEREQMKRELQRSVDQFRALAAHFPAGCIALFDTDLRYVIADGPALGAFGRTPADLEGRTVHEAFRPDTARDLAVRLRAVLDGEQQSWETHVSNGQVYENVVVPVRDAAGRVFAGASVTVDISERVKHHAEQRALRDVATLVASGAPPSTVFASVAEHVTRLFNGTFGGVVRFDAAAGTGEFVGAWSTDGTDVTGEQVDLAGASAAARVFQTGAPARIDGYADRPAEPFYRPFSITQAMCAPIFVRGTVWGAAGLGVDGEGLAPGDEERLARFADLVAVAIANAEARDLLAHQAATDPLTGLANHRTFHERLRQEIERSRRYRRELSVAVLDIDRFKEVNDAHGHQVGDEVLAEFGRRIKNVARAGDVVARIGGDEFAWIMPETSRDDAHAAVEGVRRVAEATAFPGAGMLTTSAGICAHEHGHTAEQLLRLADRALYWAKGGGRNTTFIYSEDAQHVLDSSPARGFGARERRQTPPS